VLRDESKINAAERDVDEMAIDLLAMQQPMASICASSSPASRSTPDLERVGDQAVNIAERVMDLAANPKAALNVDIPRMASLSISMVRDAINAFLTGDVDMARSSPGNATTW